MFYSFVRAVSGLNPFGKAAEATNDVVIVPVGGIDEATLNNDGEPQQAPPERERRQVREMWSNKRDLEAGEIYHEAVNDGISKSETWGCWCEKWGWDARQRYTASAETISREARSAMVALCPFSDRSNCHGLGISCVSKALQLPNVTIKHCSSGSGLWRVSMWHGSTIGVIQGQ